MSETPSTLTLTAEIDLLRARIAALQAYWQLETSADDALKQLDRLSLILTRLASLLLAQRKLTGGSMGGASSPESALIAEIAQQLQLFPSQREQREQSEQREQGNSHEPQ